MQQEQSGPADPEKAQEARHVAEDAVEAAQDGNLDEARFLAGEARSLDKAAADEALAGTALDKKGARG